MFQSIIFCSKYLRIHFQFKSLCNMKAPTNKPAVQVVSFGAKLRTSNFIKVERHFLASDVVRNGYPENMWDIGVNKVSKKSYLH